MRWPSTLLFIAAFSARAATVELQKIVPFAKANEVRVECVLVSKETVGQVEVAGRLIDPKSGSPLWNGTLGAVDLQPGKPAMITGTITNLHPQLWSPQRPSLYELKVTALMGKETLAESSVRTGFRSFESRNGNFFLNGHPTFLRGLAINPPGRTIPPEVGESRAFAQAYVRFLKTQNVNIIRMTHDSQVWFDVCDELGMMVYQGQYGSPLESPARKQTPPSDAGRSIAAYKALFETYARHPSIVIYILSNELPISGARGKAFHDFLVTAHSALRQWDPTRLVIGNAGYGEGREGDICDVHRYWGWYYNTFLTYYNLRDPALFGDPKKNQPITFTECVGNFTGPSGEYNLIVRKQLGAQLNWTGHSPAQREDALAYQSFMLKQATESFRRLRPLNPRLSGIMPFTILFDNWSGITSFDQMKPKPAMDQLAISYQPILLSWELWTPQVYAGAEIRPVAHVINDADDGRPLTNVFLRYEIKEVDGKPALQSEIKLPAVPSYGAWSRELAVQLPGNLKTGHYLLCGQISSENRLLSTNWETLFVAGEDWPAGNPLSLDQPAILFDPSDKTREALTRLNLPVSIAPDITSGISRANVLIIGEEAWNKGLADQGAKLRSFIEKGGHILYLRQHPEKFDAAWLPEPVTMFTASANAATYPPAGRPFSGNMNINPERPNHPVFAGLERHQLCIWSDYTHWNQAKPGFPQIYPVTAGFKLSKPESLARTAILANYDRGLEGAALCEMFSGQGSAIVCGFDLISRIGFDPVADRLLLNLVRYAASTRTHELHPLIDTPITWGNYQSERGLITGPQNGLIINAIWIRPPTNPNATPLTQEEGAWNTRPGDQFVAHGRSPFGPYGYTTSSSLRDGDAASKTGSGFFWVRIPTGARTMRTLVENPSAEPAELSILINDTAARSKAVLPAHTMLNISSPIPERATDVRVEFRGSKSLVLIRTEFD